MRFAAQASPLPRLRCIRAPPGDERRPLVVEGWRDHASMVHTPRAYDDIATTISSLLLRNQYQLWAFFFPGWILVPVPWDVEDDF